MESRPAEGAYFPFPEPYRARVFKRTGSGSEAQAHPVVSADNVSVVFTDQSGSGGVGTDLEAMITSGELPASLTLTADDFGQAVAYWAPMPTGGGYGGLDISIVGQNYQYMIDLYTGDYISAEVKGRDGSIRTVDKDRRTQYSLPPWIRKKITYIFSSLYLYLCSSSTVKGLLFDHQVEVGRNLSPAPLNRYDHPTSVNL